MDDGVIFLVDDSAPDARLFKELLRMAGFTGRVESVNSIAYARAALIGMAAVGEAGARVKAIVVDLSLGDQNAWRPDADNVVDAFKGFAERLGVPLVAWTGRIEGPDVDLFLNKNDRAWPVKLLSHLAGLEDSLRDDLRRYQSTDDRIVSGAAP